MALTAAQFRQDYPQFADTDDAVIDRHLTKAALRIASVAWGDFYDEAHGLITAHLLTIRDRAASLGSDATGPIRRERQDGFYDVEYAFSTSSSPEESGGYNATVYGKEFLNLQKAVVLPVRIF